MSTQNTLAPTPGLALSPPHAAKPARGQRLGKAVLRAGSSLAFVAVLVIFAATAPNFTSVGNIGNILSQSAILGVLAFGMTIVVIGGGSDVVNGGIDLSLAANLGLSAAIYAQTLAAGYGDVAAVLLCLAAGALIGAVNAFSVVVVRILPLLATLAMMNICAGFELVLTQNTVVPATSPLLDFVSGTLPGGLPMLGVLFLVLACVLIAAVQYTTTGLRLYAVGGHREASRAAGLPVAPLVAASYVASGICGALGAVLSVAFLSGSSTGSFELLLPVVLIALLGTVFSRRLVPTIGGTLVSALFIGCLTNGFQLLNISSYWVSGVEGVLILFVVAATSVLGGGSRS